MPKTISKTTTQVDLTTKAVSYTALTVTILIILSILAGLLYSVFFQFNAKRTYNKNLQSALESLKNN